MNKLRKHWVYLLVISLPFERIPSSNISLGGHLVTLRLSYLVALLGFAIFFKTVIGLLKFRWWSPHFWLLMYLFVALLSTVAALDVKKSLFALAATAITIGAGLLVSRVIKIPDLPKTYRVLAIVTAIVCIFGLYQFFGDAFGLSPSITGIAANYTHKVFGFPRIQSTGLEPLFFGNFLLLPFGLTFARILTGRRDRWTVSLMLLISTTITLTLSRGTYYAALAGIFALAALMVRRKSLGSLVLAIGMILSGIAIGVGLIVAVTTLHPYDGRGGDKALKQFAKQSTTVSATPTSADSDRVANRKLAIEAFKKRPLLGFGVGNFGAYVQSTQPGLYGSATSRVVVNNEYLEVLAETGILGALALLGFTAAMAWRIFYKFIFASLEDRVWILGLAAVAVGFAIQFYAFSTLYIMHIWVALGLLMALVRPRKETADESTS